MGEGFGGSNFQLEGVTRECMMRVREERDVRGESVWVSWCHVTN